MPSLIRIGVSPGGRWPLTRHDKTKRVRPKPHPFVSLDLRGQILNGPDPESRLRFPEESMHTLAWSAPFTPPFPTGVLPDTAPCRIASVLPLAHLSPRDCGMDVVKWSEVVPVPFQVTLAVPDVAWVANTLPGNVPEPPVALVGAQPLKLAVDPVLPPSELQVALAGFGPGPFANADPGSTMAAVTEAANAGRIKIRAKRIPNPLVEDVVLAITTCESCDPLPSLRVSTPCG